MQIATWNVNGIKARIDNVLAWLKEASPDIACLQEIKSVDEGFPALEIEALGYNVATHGQKGFNGVAILSKLPFDEVNKRLPGDHISSHIRIKVSALWLFTTPPVTEHGFYYKRLRSSGLFTPLPPLLSTWV